MKFTLLTFALIITTFSFAQSTTTGIEHVINSEIYNGERKISIFLPSAYEAENTNENYVVAYVFDAQFQPYYSMASSMMSYYAQTNEGVPMIIVGIHTKNRWAEFAPRYLEEGNYNENTHKLSTFLSKEVIPYVEKTYRVKPFKVGIGHSLGGSYVINEIIKENAIFNAVIAASPNLTIHNEQIVRQAAAFYLNYPNTRRFIYTSVGTIGEMEGNFKNSLLHLDSISSKYTPKNMTWNCKVLQGENHMTTFIPTFNKGYLSLSAKLKLLDADLIHLAEDSKYKISDAINNFYDELALFSNEKNAMTIEKVMSHAFKLSQYKRYDAASDLFHFSKSLVRQSDKTLEEKNTLKEKIETHLLRIKFNKLALHAKQLSNNSDYQKASELYTEAFNLNVLRGTHMERINAVPVFAQAGKTAAAFAQLELLVNYFKLRGNAMFINDALCTPLHNSPKWEECMRKLTKNSE